MSVRVGVAIPAAGLGRRMGGQRKTWLELEGEPLLLHALRPFLADDRVVAVRVALAPDEVDERPAWIEQLDARVACVAGGATRAESVARAAVALPADVDLILVHDAARPLVTSAVIDRVIAGAQTGRGAIAAIPAVDTIKRVADDGHIVETPPRASLWMAQTPQGFPAALLRDALERMENDAPLAASITDDASLVEAIGGEVFVVEGDPVNIKVTRPEDLRLAQTLRAGDAQAPTLRLLFVCTGNTCRSPMAEALARSLAEQRGWSSRLQVGSAGVAAAEGAGASWGAREAVEQAGLSLAGHQARQLSPELLESADLVLTMSTRHLEAVTYMGGQGRAALLSAFAEQGRSVLADPAQAAAGASVPDPFGGDAQVYGASFQALRDLVERTLDQLAPELAHELAP